MVLKQRGYLPGTPEFTAALVDKLTKECQLKQIEPIFYRDGWYYNRYTKLVWYELWGTAWLAGEDGVDDFLKSLASLGSRTLTTAEIAAIRVLQVYRNCPEELLHQLYNHDHINYIRNLVLDMRRNGLRALNR